MQCSITLIHINFNHHIIMTHEFHKFKKVQLPNRSFNISFIIILFFPIYKKVQKMQFVVNAPAIQRVDPLIHGNDPGDSSVLYPSQMLIELIPLFP